MTIRTTILAALSLSTFAAGALAQRAERSERPPFQAPDDVVWEKDVEYGRAGDVSLRLDVLRPAEPPEGRMPVVLYIHGGGFTRGSKEQGLQGNLIFARSGYYTVSIDYRLAPQHSFPAPIEDCKAAVRWLRANADRLGIDPDAIGAWGTSAGGSLVSLLGTSGGAPELEGPAGNAGVSSRLDAVVDGYGPTNFLSITEQRAKVPGRDSFERGYLGGDLEDVLEEARLASAVTHASKDDPPFLLLHGTEDPVVPFAQAEELRDALAKAGAEALLVPIVGAGHGWGPRNQEVPARMLAFFDRHLKGRDVEVSAEPIEDAGRPEGRGR